VVRRADKPLPDIYHCGSRESPPALRARVLDLLTSDRSRRYTPLGVREDAMNKIQLLPGTLDLLILRILELGPNHGR